MKIPHQELIAATNNHLQLLETSRQVEPKLSNFSHNFNIREVGVEIFGNTATTPSRALFKQQLCLQNKALFTKSNVSETFLLQDLTSPIR